MSLSAGGYRRPLRLWQKIHTRLGRKNCAPPMKFGAFGSETGDWRICYIVDGDRLIVLVLIVGQRGDIYERLRRRLG